MSSRRQDARDGLKKRLIDAAEMRIAGGGLRGLKARDVTADAGCALGALYTAFDDLDLLVIHVNSRTLGRLGAALAASVPDGAGPKDVLAALAQGYLGFALGHTRLWLALFTHRLPEGVEVPDWHVAEHAVLIAQIIRPLSALRPDLPPEAVTQRAKTVFAAVHGVVHLAMTARFVATPVDRLSAEVDALVTAMMRGLAG
jgi:AcrR family transcriptional regulator